MKNQIYLIGAEKPKLAWGTQSVTGLWISIRDYYDAYQHIVRGNIMAPISLCFDEFVPKYEMLKTEL